VQYLGNGFDYFALPADETRGGIFLAWHTDVWSVSSTSAWDFSVSARVAPVARGDQWWITLVYGAASEDLKPNFLTELHDPRQVRDDPWLLIGDFNMIYRAQDKKQWAPEPTTNGAVQVVLERANLTRNPPL
jgi:hypothetical protein